jgi:DNA-binding transcriptional MerR regulator
LRQRCCLAKDEQQAAKEREPVPQPGEDAPASVPPANIHQITGLMQELARKSSSRGERAEFEKLLAKTKPVLDYMEQQPAIEAACQAIEAHRADFDKLVEDEKAYLERTQALFAEERFVPLRFTADEVHRAFDKVGHPPPGSSSDRFVEIVLKAILHLADKERRSGSAMSMLMHLPDYVAADRPLDAWIIQHCAYLTGEKHGESNPFLFQMFSYGYDAWVAEQRGREAALLRQVGMDLSRLEGMSMEEIDAWLQEQKSDPVKLARMEEVMLANPEQRAQAEANLEQLERDAHKLLERKDAAHLLLPLCDVQSWLPRLNECWARACEQFPNIEDPSPSPAAGKALMEALFPLLGEMVAQLFTPERTRQLAGQLKSYRNARYAAGDKQTTTLANGAIVSLGDGRDPASSHFLYTLSYFSLMKGLETMANLPQAQSQSSDEMAG